MYASSSSLSSQIISSTNANNLTPSSVNGNLNQKQVKSFIEEYIKNPKTVEYFEKFIQELNNAQEAQKQDFYNNLVQLVTLESVHDMIRLAVKGNENENNAKFKNLFKNFFEHYLGALITCWVNENNAGGNIPEIIKNSLRFLRSVLLFQEDEYTKNYLGCIRGAIKLFPVLQQEKNRETVAEILETDVRELYDTRWNFFSWLFSIKYRFFGILFSIVAICLAFATLGLTISPLTLIVLGSLSLVFLIAGIVLYILPRCQLQNKPSEGGVYDLLAYIIGGIGVALLLTFSALGLATLAISPFAPLMIGLFAVGLLLAHFIIRGQMKYILSYTLVGVGCGLLLIMGIASEITILGISLNVFLGVGLILVGGAFALRNYFRHKNGGSNRLRARDRLRTTSCYIFSLHAMAFSIGGLAMYSSFLGGAAAFTVLAPLCFTIAAFTLAVYFLANKNIYQSFTVYAYGFAIAGIGLTLLMAVPLVSLSFLFPVSLAIICVALLVVMGTYIYGLYSNKYGHQDYDPLIGSADSSTLTTRSPSNSVSANDNFYDVNKAEVMRALLWEDESKDSKSHESRGLLSSCCFFSCFRSQPVNSAEQRDEQKVVKNEGQLSTNEKLPASGSSQAENANESPSAPQGATTPIYGGSFKEENVVSPPSSPKGAAGSSNSFFDMVLKEDKEAKEAKAKAEQAEAKPKV